VCIHKGKLTPEIQNTLESKGYIFDDIQWSPERLIIEMKNFKTKHNRIPADIKKPKNDEEKFESSIVNRFYTLKSEITPQIRSELEQLGYNFEDRKWTLKKTTDKLNKFAIKYGRTPLLIQNPETEDEKYEDSLAWRFNNLRTGRTFKNSFNPDIQAELESYGYSFEVRGRSKTE
jgi:hypothetical protein